MLTPAEQRAFGQQKRKTMKRTDHAACEIKRSRRKDPVELMQASMRGRVPKLVTLKYERMLASPFGFFRGAVPVMAYDLSLLPTPGIVCQLCGDAHVRNLGAYAGPDGRLVFDINDFDETIAGPFEWDVKRLATSLILAGREAGAKSTACHEAARVFLASYRDTVLMLARLPVLEMARFQVHRLREVAAVSNIFALAERATPLHTLEALTQSGGAAKAKTKAAAKRSASKKTAKRPERQHRIFRTQEPVLTRVTGAMAKKVIHSLVPYAQTLEPERRDFLALYRPVDVAFKVVGTGSVGLRDYCVYMQGNGANDPLFLQVKEEVQSGWAPYVRKIAGDRVRGQIATHQGHRVVDGERSMQLQSDPFLGWTTLEGRQYLVRQLNDHKASINLADLRAAELMEYAAVCGELLARGHSRSGGGYQIAGYLGASARFDDAVTTFAEGYADQTEEDWKALSAWWKRQGRKLASTAEKSS